MAHYKADESVFSKVKDTVVVISGGATGIGAATVQILAQNGAKVVLGDINADAAEQLCKTYSGLSFVKCDVANYDDIYNLFKTAYDQHGRVDHAISSAGTFGQSNYTTGKSSSEYYPHDDSRLIICSRNGQLL